MKFDIARHPVTLLPVYANMGVTKIHLSFYAPVEDGYDGRPATHPDGWKSSRVTFQESLQGLLKEDAGETWLRIMSKSLPPGREMALNSLCFAQGFQKHIPMLDLVAKGEKHAREVCDNITNSLEMATLILFESGASYHAYGLELLEPEEWVRFMGRALLEPGVDQPYIGRRLMAGYGCLRWTSHVKKGFIQRVDA